MESQDSSETIKLIRSLEERVSLLERVVGGLAQKTGFTAPVAAFQEQKVLTNPAVAVAVAAKPKTSTEIEVGQKWLSVVGVVLIFLAALFFVQFVFQYMGPAGKVALSYLGAAILFGIAAFTKQKYQPFAAVVSAGAWGITFLVTYAMYFFPATRLITSAPAAMFLLAVVVAALALVAFYQRSKVLVSLSLVLGVLTMVLTPLSLFSIIGTVLLLGVFVFIAITMSWGDFVLPATIGAYIAYVCWFNNVLGRLPAQGGGLMEKQMIGLAALIVMLLIIAVGLVLRRDEEKSVNGQSDVLTIILASGGTSMLGLLALKELVLTVSNIRLAVAMWLLLLSVLIGGWSVIAREFRQKKNIVISGGVITLVLLMSSLAYFFPIRSGGTVLAWAVLGLLVVLAGILRRNAFLAAFCAIPLMAGAVRFITIDMQTKTALLTNDISISMLIGLVLAVAIIGSAALLRMTDLDTRGDKKARHLPGVLLVTGLIVIYIITAKEFSGAIPSVIWGIAGLLIILSGLLAHWKDARIVGLIGLAVTVVRVFIHDLSNLEALPRVISFAILGGLLLLVGFGYNQNKDKLQKYLVED